MRGNIGEKEEVFIFFNKINNNMVNSGIIRGFNVKKDNNRGGYIIDNNLYIPSIRYCINYISNKKASTGNSPIDFIVIYNNGSKKRFEVKSLKGSPPTILNAGGRSISGRIICDYHTKNIIKNIIDRTGYMVPEDIRKFRKFMISSNKKEEITICHNETSKEFIHDFSQCKLTKEEFFKHLKEQYLSGRTSYYINNLSNLNDPIFDYLCYIMLKNCDELIIQKRQGEELCFNKSNILSLKNFLYKNAFFDYPSITKNRNLVPRLFYDDIILSFKPQIRLKCNV